MSKTTIKQLGLNFYNSRSEKDYTELYHRIMPGLKNHIYSFVKDRDAVEDIAIVAMTKAYNKIEQYNPDYTISTWIYTIASNEARQYIKKKRAKGHRLFSALEYTNDSGNSSLDKLESIIAVENEYMVNEHTKAENEVIQKEFETAMDIINKMKDSYKDILIDRFVNDLSYNELAEKYDVNLQIIKNRINRGKIKIEKEFAKRLQTTA